jgi:hypothetical protein
MSLDNFNIHPAQLLSVYNKMIFLPDFKRNEFIDIEPHYMNLSSKSSEEEEDDFNYFNYADSSTFISSILDPNPMPSLEDIFPIHSIESESKKDSVIIIEKVNLFSNIEKNSVLVKNGEDMLKRKRFQDRRPRKENQDNIRKKIKRGFFNNGLIKKLNEKLKNIGSNKYLRKFPQHFVSDVNQKRNKELFNLTLKEIFVNKELYLNEDKEGLRNYSQNLKVVQSEEISENKELKIIFNKTINELYEEYINSDEFNIIEINRLKEKKMQDDYIKRYINLARYLILFFTQ